MEDKTWPCVSSSRFGAIWRLNGVGVIYMQWHTHILRRRRSCGVDSGDRMKRYVVPGLVLVMPGSSECIFGWFAGDLDGRWTGQTLALDVFGKQYDASRVTRHPDASRNATRSRRPKGPSRTHAMPVPVVGARAQCLSLGRGSLRHPQDTSHPVD